MKWQCSLTRAGLGITLFCMVGGGKGLAATACVNASGTQIVCTSDSFSGVNSFETSLLFPYFDNTVGELESVTFGVSESALGSVTLNNTNASGNPWIRDRSFSLSSSVVVSAPATPVWTLTSGTAAWQGTTPNERLQHGATRTIASPQAVTGANSASHDTGLDAFMGSGLFTVGVSVTPGYSAPNPALPDGVTTSYSWTTTGIVVVTYNYLPAADPPDVPEPATMVLFSSALLSLALLRKRFQR